MIAVMWEAGHRVRVRGADGRRVAVEDADDQRTPPAVPEEPVDGVAHRARRPEPAGASRVRCRALRSDGLVPGTSNVSTASRHGWKRCGGQIGAEQPVLRTEEKRDFPRGGDPTA